VESSSPPNPAPSTSTRSFMRRPYPVRHLPDNSGRAMVARRARLTPRARRIRTAAGTRRRGETPAAPRYAGVSTGRELTPARDEPGKSEPELVSRLLRYAMRASAPVSLTRSSLVRSRHAADRRLGARIPARASAQSATASPRRFPSPRLGHAGRTSPCFWRQAGALRFLLDTHFCACASMEGGPARFRRGDDRRSALVRSPSELLADRCCRR
jgi:hypothetical protein